MGGSPSAFSALAALRPSTARVPRSAQDEEGCTTFLILSGAKRSRRTHGVYELNPPAGAEEFVGEAVVEGVEGGGEDVGGDAYRRRDVAALVRRLDHHAGDGAGAVLGREDADLVVGEAD